MDILFIESIVVWVFFIGFKLVIIISYKWICYDCKLILFGGFKLWKIDSVCIILYEYIDYF